MAHIKPTRRELLTVAVSAIVASALKEGERVSAYVYEDHNHFLEYSKGVYDNGHGNLYYSVREEGDGERHRIFTTAERNAFFELESEVTCMCV